MNGNGSPSGLFLLLEKLAALVLILVDVGLVWLLLAGYWPEQFATNSTHAGVVTSIVLLSAALVLVTAVAILHTRDSAK